MWRSRTRENDENEGNLIQPKMEGISKSRRREGFRGGELTIRNRDPQSLRETRRSCDRCQRRCYVYPYDRVDVEGSSRWG